MTTTITTIIAASVPLGIARTETAMIKVGAELELTITPDRIGSPSHSYLLSKVQNGSRTAFGDKFSSLIQAVEEFNRLVSEIEVGRDIFVAEKKGDKIIHGEFCSQKGCSGTRGTCGRLNGFAA